MANLELYSRVCTVHQNGIDSVSETLRPLLQQVCTTKHYSRRGKHLFIRTAISYVLLSELDEN